MTQHPILIDGAWRAADAASFFQAENPATEEKLPGEYPVSRWSDVNAALAAASRDAPLLAAMPAEKIAAFLERFAERIEGRAEELSATAHAETALPVSPRLADVELPRTTNQLRLAAGAACDGSWRRATIDSAANIRSCLAALGPVAVFGPNNFPFAFGSISGGDFAAAIAAGNPVIAKANSSHPATTRLFAEEAHLAAQETEMPPATVQLIYRTAHEDGERLVADPRIGATGYTGSRRAGLALKAATDRNGKPIYLELSSVNPVVLLPGVLRERGADLAEEFGGSCLMGVGQFCTSPGIVLMLSSREADAFITGVAEKLNAAPVGTLLSAAVQASLEKSVVALRDSGAELLVGGAVGGGGAGRSYANTLLRVDGGRFLIAPDSFQAEAFGNAALIVVADDADQLAAIIDCLEGNLTGCIYSAADDADDALYNQLAPRLRTRVGRLLNDKMPTGVAISIAMNHGGPFPATGHPGFTAVGIPAAMNRFAALHCYDNVRSHRLPACLQDKNPNGVMQRCIDGSWSTSNAPSA